MLEQIITPHTAILATRYLMELDINAIREPYQRDISHWVINLKQAQKNYLRSQYAPKKKITETTQPLTELVQCVKTITTLLSDEAKHQLQDWLLMNIK